MTTSAASITLPTLYQRLEFFSVALSEIERHRICAAVSRNNLRLVGQCPLSVSRRPLQAPYGPKPSPVTLENWRSSIRDWAKYFETIPGSTPLQRAVLLNKQLEISGLCPLIYYAFDQWWSVDRNLEDLIDLSTAYAYRLISFPQKARSGTWIGAGAYCDVWRCTDGEFVEKVARNLAAKVLAIPQEIAVSHLLIQTSLVSHIPELLSFDVSDGSLRRRYVSGPAGTDFVNCGNVIPNVKSLQSIYNICDDVYHKLEINLDIHPGNFRWSVKEAAWKLVDLGPMPKIGSEYFPRGNFEVYLKKIWLDLPRLVREVPIRSLDLGAPTQDEKDCINLCKLEEVNRV